MEQPAVGIVGTGLAVPANRLTNDQIAERVDTTDEWIVSRTGIRARHVIDTGTDTSDLAVAAARTALERAQVAADEVDLVLTATVSGDMPFPSVSCMVQEQLGLKRASAMDVGAACSGFIYGLVTGSAFIETGRARTVLLVGADALSKMLDWTDRSTCVLFGDGAGAAVLQPVEPGYGLLASYLGSDGSGGKLLNVGPRVGEANGHRYLQMQGREVYKFAVRIQGEAIDRALERSGLQAGDIDWLLPHQANIRIIEAAAQRLKMPMERVLVNVDEYGNTSAASIPIALAEADAAGRLQRGDRIMMVGFGAGLTYGAALVRWL